ncbi:hypothetical protein GYH30_044705 [Glycine max]|uniref:Uncharacterized protein n=1 Tax=Glycine max TaxID=3847 RepID=A0A0R0FZD8_SOYBN|nr:hypothetical protein GYH30_044705 [Glycine max]
MQVQCLVAVKLHTSTFPRLYCEKGKSVIVRRISQKAKSHIAWDNFGSGVYIPFCDMQEVHEFGSQGLIVASNNSNSQISHNFGN